MFETYHGDSQKENLLDPLSHPILLLVGRLSEWGHLWLLQIQAHEPWGKKGFHLEYLKDLMNDIQLQIKIILRIIQPEIDMIWMIW